MNCKQAKSEIALWAGNDLDDSALQGLQDHLDECPCCSSHWARMKQTVDLLHRGTEEELPREYVGSVWPEVAAQIAVRRESLLMTRFNGWLPAVAVSAACAALLMVALRATNDQHGGSMVQQPFFPQQIESEPLVEEIPGTFYVEGPLNNPFDPLRPNLDNRRFGEQRPVITTVGDRARYDF